MLSCSKAVKYAGVKMLKILIILLGYTLMLFVENPYSRRRPNGMYNKNNLIHIGIELAY